MVLPESAEACPYGDEDGQDARGAPHGEKDDFAKITVTLPRPVRQLLLNESHLRKTKRDPDWSISVIVREALAAYLGTKTEKPSSRREDDL